MKKRKKEKDAIDRITEWQQNQYDPGHYLGGNLPPILKNPAKPKWIGISTIITGIIILIVIIFNDVYAQNNNAVSNIIGLTIVAFFFWIGYGFIKKERVKTKLQVNHRNHKKE